MDQIAPHLSDSPHETSSDAMDWSIFDDVDFGIAIFDPSLKLVRVNGNYATLCGYHISQVAPGTEMAALIATSLVEQGLPRQEVETLTATAILRLRSVGKHKFHYKTMAGKYLSISRCKQADGTVVETVYEHAPYEASNQNGGRLMQLAEIAHNRMAQALDTIGDGFALFDAHDRLVVYNQQYVETNPHISDLIKPGADYASMLKTGIQRDGIKKDGMEHDELFEWEMERHRNPDKPYERQLHDGRWFRISEKRTPDGGTVGIRSDITELKNRELEVARISTTLAETNDQFDVALNNMIQGLCMFDADQNLILCNQQYLKMYGFSDKVVKPGIKLSDIMRYSISLGNYHEEDAEAALNARHDPNKLKKRTTIKQYLRDGRVIAVMNEPMSNGGSIATYQDITTLEMNEAKLLAYNEKLERSNAELQDFAYVASHDLQEPLRKIEAFGDRLVKKYGDLLPDDGKMFIDRMQNAAFRMRGLINDLLSYSRVSTKAKPFEPTKLEEIIDGVQSDLQIRIQECNATIEYNGLPELEADPVQMRQLFQNLISNALKFTKPDVDPIITISAEKFIVPDATGLKLEYSRIRLADNGIGFENKYKDQIFTIFKRLHGRLEYEGTGIGLATCRKIVERHNGTIDAQGEPDVGATFIIELPVKQQSEGD